VKPGRKAAKRGARSSSRAVVAMAVMGGLVLLYGWNSFFLAPRSRAKATAAKELATAKQNEQDLRQSLAELRKLADATTAREAELARLGRLVPSDPDLAGAILALNDVANQAQVAWSSFAPSPPAPSAGGGVSLAVQMKVGGTFAQIFDYLRRLETLDRLVVVDSIQLAAASAGNGSPKIDVDVRARLFAAGTASPATPALAKAGG
jgi:type IV pilus assembly protein PilO